MSNVDSLPTCSIVLRGSSGHLLDEAERSLHDALAVLTETIKEPSIVFGGGASEVGKALYITCLNEPKLLPTDLDGGGSGRGGA
jgi:T-complex protein 1 subunit beta